MRRRIDMLMHAKEARTAAINKIDKRSEQGLIAAENAIADAINKRELSCWCRRYLTDQAIAKLKEYGYEVEDFSSQLDGICFKISW